MNENNKERSLADVEKRFYETMSKNTVFSSLNRSASALESLALSANAITHELKNASNLSTKLSKRLNGLTLCGCDNCEYSFNTRVRKVCDCGKYHGAQPDNFFNAQNPAHSRNCLLAVTLYA